MPQARPPRNPDGSPPCLHQAVGGTAAWRRLSEAFYGRVAQDPRLRHLFPGKSFHCAIEELTAFLVQLFGGPGGDTQRRWWLSLHESHQRFKIGHEERAAWLENMRSTLDDMPMAPEHRAALLRFFEDSSAHVVNTGGPVPTAALPANQPAGATEQEIARRWQGQCALDQFVAALRANNAESALSLMDGQVLLERFQYDRSGLAGVLGLMLGVDHPSIQAYVHTRLTMDPTLVTERFAGRTLLHQAAALGHRPFVELLLRLGADPNGMDGGEHTPLYSLANEYRGNDGGPLVRILVQAGSKVDANGGAKRCTALHMAARRGSVEIAEALLDCGAAIEARDSLGETPLRRAVNCDKIRVAALLLNRSADPHSLGSKRRTPFLAARSEAMKALLQSRK
ncbi:ankyrin repeat domain-containing protein [Paludibaculum fermentans]|uniref:Ankyrin repeat domain-containing protein n=1 Tax=Paludibaculum fermentans TaxID=1473598 RepID=A0A7S7NQX6_PALFE|nr:ankyrin repeat domain-containing protein [Paludibaculum fermentans]QOY87674.1 ankyrin repeat domain-containing protein [Paludibaculum fermentans]